MDDSFDLVFGKPPQGIACRDRKAAYAVIHDSQGRVAAVCADVRGRDQFWLPGGGMLDHEAPEQTIIREVREELARSVRIQRPIGQAIQFFYAGDEACWYKMKAWFYAADLQEPTEHQADYELLWVNPGSRHSDFFHESHAWAALAAASATKQ